MADGQPNGIPCPCGIGDLRVYRTTRVPGGFERDRRCKCGHRVITVEVTRFVRLWIRRKSPSIARASKAEG